MWAVNQFSITDLSKDLALKIYAQADLKIYLNGNLVYDNKILTKRHYDEVNLRDFRQFLKKGENVIGFELTNAVADSDFDFGLYEFNKET